MLAGPWGWCVLRRVRTSGAQELDRGGRGWCGRALPIPITIPLPFGRKSVQGGPPQGLLFLGGGGGLGREGQGCIRRGRSSEEAPEAVRQAVAKAVGGGYCRLQMPLKLALAVRWTVTGHRLGAPGGVGVPPPPPMHPWGGREGESRGEGGGVQPPLWDADACARPVPSGTKQKCRAKAKEKSSPVTRHKGAAVELQTRRVRSESAAPKP